MFLIHQTIGLIVAGSWLAESHDPYPYLERGPSDQRVYPGENAMFECDLRNIGKEDIIWFHHETDSYLTDELLIATHRDNRYLITRNSSSESFRLWIMNVQFDDAGTYACVWRGRCSLPMAWVELTVVGAPTPSGDAGGDSSIDDSSDVIQIPPDTDGSSTPSLNPICEISAKSHEGADDDDDHDIGDEIILICKSPHGVPHSTVEWFRNGRESLAGPFQTNIGYQRYLNHDDGKATFTCVMESPFILGSRNCSVGPMLLSVTKPGRPGLTLSESSNGSHALASISATFGICCLILVVAVAYILFNKTKSSKRQQIAAVLPTVTTVSVGGSEGYLALNTQHKTPQYQQLKSPPNGRLLRLQPPPRKTRMAKSAAVGKQSHIYAAPQNGQSNLQVGRNLNLSRSEDSIHTYEFPT